MAGLNSLAKNNYDLPTVICSYYINKKMQKILVILTSIIILVGCRSNKELNQLRKQYLKSDAICDCDGVFELPEEYKTLKAFPKALALIDSIQNAENFSQKILFYEDSLIKKTLNYKISDPLAYVYIYIKNKHVFQGYSYTNDLYLSHHFYMFDPIEIGCRIKYDSLGNIEKKYYKNYIKIYKTEEEGEKIKKKHPICWREAYLLAKKFAGVTDDKESYELSRGDIYKNNWYVAFGDYHKDIYIVNSKNGRVK